MEGHLSIKEIHDRLQELDGWEMGFDSITRNFRFEGFKEAMAFVNKIAEEAEKMNHHPEIRINYDKVFISLTTHDAGGITIKDFKLAKAIERLVREQ